MIAFLDCDEIVKCRKILQHNGRVCILLDYMNLESLTNLVSSERRNFTEKSCKYILYKIAQGLHKMHSYQVLHRDVKSENILINDEGDIKIADLGMSVFLCVTYGSGQVHMCGCTC